MAKWWCNSANDGRALLVVLTVALAVLSGCDRDRKGTSAGGSDRVVDGALPTPAGTSGGSVTGMPTSPPAMEPGPVEEPMPAPVAGEPPEGAVPADPNAVPVDPATGLAVGAQPPAPPAVGGSVDAGAAAAVVREYMAALGSGAFASAQQLWSATPNDSAVLQLARGAAFAVDIAAPARPADSAAAAAGVVTVPVQVRGTADDGTERSLVATYTVRRTPEGAWRIASASVREDAP